MDPAMEAMAVEIARAVYDQLKSEQAAERKQLSFDEQRHPRGQPENAGEFAPGSGGNAKEAEPAASSGWDDFGADETPQEPKMGMSDEQLREAARRKPLAFPSHEGVDDVYINDAWQTVSKLWPEMASKVTRIGQYDPRTVPQGMTPPNAFIDPATGILAVKPNTPLDPSTLWHELVHLEQQHRGIMKPRDELEPDAYNAIETEAHARGNQAKELIGRFKAQLAGRKQLSLGVPDDVPVTFYVGLRERLRRVMDEPVTLSFNEADHPRGQPGHPSEFVEKGKGTGPSSKPAAPGNPVAEKPNNKGKGKFIGAVVDGAVQQHAEKVKHVVAQMVGGIPEEETSDAGQKDKKPYDVKIPGGRGRKDQDLEVKSMTVGGKQAISVHEDALLRKVDHQQSTGNGFHTIVVDERATYGDGANKDNYSGHRLYYKRGSGRYSLSKMHKVKDEAELKRLVAMPDDKLPEAARGSLPPPPPISHLRKQAAQASESRSRRDKARKEKNKDKLREQARARAVKAKVAAGA